MRSLLSLGSIVALACGRPATDQRPRVRNPTLQGGGASKPAGRRAPVDLGPGLEVAELSPGRFAGALSTSNVYTHARNWVRDAATAIFVVKLAPGGAATACR